jgi:pimeloyl-ACP methyl ester carboxylesterase
MAHRTMLPAPALAIALVLGLLATTRAGAGDHDPLPRRSGAATFESYPGTTVLYDDIRDPAGERLRLIATHPDRPGRYPVIFVAGWLSCDSVEAPAGAMDGSSRLLQAVVQTPGFATLRMDKPGVGDSEGRCDRTDFTAELAAYRQAFRHLKDYDFVDPQRIYVLGISNGGGFAPLVADGAPVQGYVVDGGWIKTWFEHMLEIERRRLALAGHPAAQINALMKSEEQLYSAYLLEQRSPHEILAQHPELKALWEGADDQQYGRPPAFYQQLQQLDLMAAWSKVSVPVLALHGEYDWIMSRDDPEILVELVNRNRPGAARFVELPHTGHTFENYASLEDAYAGRQRPFDESIARLVRDWFTSQLPAAAK